MAALSDALHAQPADEGAEERTGVIHDNYSGLSTTTILAGAVPG
jgi:hypothetical protein